jgi:hypothetical protein
MKFKGLYVNHFSLYPCIFKEVKEIEETGNYIIKAHNPQLGMDYMFYFGCNETNKKLVNKLKEGMEMVVYGTIKTSRGGSEHVILRAKQIIVEGQD